MLSQNVLFCQNVLDDYKKYNNALYIFSFLMEVIMKEIKQLSIC